MGPKMSVCTMSNTACALVVQSFAIGCFLALFNSQISHTSTELSLIRIPSTCSTSLLRSVKLLWPNLLCHMFKLLDSRQFSLQVLSISLKFQMNQFFSCLNGYSRPLFSIMLSSGPIKTSAPVSLSLLIDTRLCEFSGINKAFSKIIFLLTWLLFLTKNATVPRPQISDRILQYVQICYSYGTSSALLGRHFHLRFSYHSLFFAQCRSWSHLASTHQVIYPHYRN